MKKLKWLLLLLLTITGCTPSVIDTLTQDPSEVARWLDAGKRIYLATGISWTPEQGKCSGPGCAYSVPEFTDGAYNKIGDGYPPEFRARVLEGLDDDLDGQTKVHELLHTMLVMHVTSDSVMNPSAGVGRDCISEAELWQLCHILQGRCTRQVPECSVKPGWKLIVPGLDAQVDPVLWEERIAAGKTLVELVLEATGSPSD